MAKVIVLGDAHLGKGESLGKSGLGTALNSRILDQLGLLNWTLQQAISEGASAIICTGDVFEDPKPSPTLISVFISWLKECTGSDINVHVVKGNHDIIRSGQHNVSAFDVVAAAEIEGVFIHNTIQTLEFDGISFTMLPFRDRRSFNTNINSEALKSLQDKIAYEVCGIDSRNIKVAIGHFAFAGSLPIGDEVDDMHNEIFIPLETMDSYDFSFFGHIHKPQVMRKGTSYACHIGSMDLSNFSENTHEKVIAIIDSEKSSVFDFRELPTRPLKQVSVSVPADIINSTEYVNGILAEEKPDLSKAIVRMSVSYESPDIVSIDRPLIEATLKGLGAYHIARIDQERKIVQVKRNTSINIENTVDEFSAIKTYASDNVEEGMREDFIALANSIVRETNASV